MRRTLTLTAALLAGLAGFGLDSIAAQAAASAKPAACAAHSVRREVRVSERRDGKVVRRHGKVVMVSRSRCVKAKVAAKPTAPSSPVTTTTPATSTPTPSAPVTTTPTTTTPVAATAPAVSYKASVDPSFTQAADDPLAVTYSYSADASALDGGSDVDLATAGELPTGILNFYSPSSPGGPAGLLCSIEVGGDVTGGQCPVSYTAPGTYNVTTEYIPDGISAVTETDSETINLYGSTVSEQVAYSSPAGGPAGYGQLLVTPTVLDQNGGPLSAAVQVVIHDQQTGATATLPTTGTLTVTEQVGELLVPGPIMPIAEMIVQPGDALQIVTRYLGDASHSGSASAPATVTVS